MLHIHIHIHFINLSVLRLFGLESTASSQLDLEQTDADSSSCAIPGWLNLFIIYILQYFSPPGSCRAHSTFSPLTSPPASSSPSSTPTPTWSSSRGKETGDNHDQTDGFLNDTFVIVPPLCIYIRMYIFLYMDDIMVVLPVKDGQIM